MSCGRYRFLLSLCLISVTIYSCHRSYLSPSIVHSNHRRASQYQERATSPPSILHPRISQNTDLSFLCAFGSLSDFDCSSLFFIYTLNLFVNISLITYGLIAPCHLSSSETLCIDSAIMEVRLLVVGLFHRCSENGWRFEVEHRILRVFSHECSFFPLRCHLQRSLKKDSTEVTGQVEIHRYGRI